MSVGIMGQALKDAVKINLYRIARLASQGKMDWLPTLEQTQAKIIRVLEWSRPLAKILQKLQVKIIRYLGGGKFGIAAEVTLSGKPSVMKLPNDGAELACVDMISRQKLHGIGDGQSPHLPEILYTTKLPYGSDFKSGSFARVYRDGEEYERQFQGLYFRELVEVDRSLGKEERKIIADLVERQTDGRFVADDIHEYNFGFRTSRKFPNSKVHLIDGKEYVYFDPSCEV